MAEIIIRKPDDPQSCSECFMHDLADMAAAEGTYLNYCIAHCPIMYKQKLKVISFKSKRLKINLLEEIKKRRAENERNT